jgi:uridine kinase
VPGALPVYNKAMQRAELIQTLADHIATFNPGHPLRVAIDGVDAAGKTTFANDLAQALNERPRAVIRVSGDDFHHPKTHRYRRGPFSPEGFYRDAINTTALMNELLIPLGPDGGLHFRPASFDLRKDRPLALPQQTAAPDAILIVDGIFLLRPELIAHWDLTIFLKCDFEITLARGVARDKKLFNGASKTKTRYLKRYIPGQRLYFDEVRPLDKADIVIDNNNLEAPLFIRFEK